MPKIMFASLSPLAASAADSGVYPLGHEPSSEADIVIDDEIQSGMSDYEDAEVVAEDAPQGDAPTEPPVLLSTPTWKRSPSRRSGA